MKGRPSQRFWTFLGLDLLVGLTYGGIRLFSFLFSTLNSLNPAIAAALVAGVIAITGSVFAVVLGRYFEKRKEVEAAFRERRLKTYEGFISTFMDLTSEKSIEKDLVPFLRQINKELILWAGPKLLKAYIKFFKQSVAAPKAGKTFFLLEDFYKAIREDLGHSNVGLERGEILVLIIKLDELSTLLRGMRDDPNYMLP
jgi:hypothetical protein